MLGHTIDLGQRAVEILEVGDHHVVPQVEPLQLGDQVLVDHRELAGEVRLDIDVLVFGLDRRGDTDDVGDGRRRRDGHAVGVAHAVLLDARTQAAPVHRHRLVDLDIATALVAQQFERILRHDAALPQAALVRPIAASLLGELGRRPVGVVAHRFHRAVGKGHRAVGCIRMLQEVQAILEAHDAQAHRTMLEVGVARLGDGVIVDVDHVVEHAHGGLDGRLELVVVELPRA